MKTMRMIPKTQAQTNSERTNPIPPAASLVLNISVGDHASAAGVLALHLLLLTIVH
jgi:hypothetical protein